MLALHQTADCGSIRVPIGEGNVKAELIAGTLYMQIIQAMLIPLVRNGKQLAEQLLCHLLQL